MIRLGDLCIGVLKIDHVTKAEDAVIAVDSLREWHLLAGDKGPALTRVFNFAEYPVGL